MVSQFICKLFVAGLKFRRVVYRGLGVCALCPVSSDRVANGWERAEIALSAWRKSYKVLVYVHVLSNNLSLHSIRAVMETQANQFGGGLGGADKARPGTIDV